ncbi:MAG: Ldh family oxidoreductase [Anaerolineae bacterium]|nr:Ldh family oxidoreductase [Anaerolineae bacterium]
MNFPPETCIQVPYRDLQAFVSQVGQAAGLPQDKAGLLADLLVSNDLRGVFSHGSRQIAAYARLMRDGKLNDNPQVHVVHETPVSLLIDGDGGLGYFPAYQGTMSLIDKVRAQGVGVLLTRNHGHFGAAGIYSRLTLAHDLLCFVTSGHQLNLAPGQPIFNAAGGSPMSFSAPTADQDPLVLDFGAMHDLYSRDPYRDEIARKAPGIVFRSLGMGTICQAWGGLLAGVPIDPARATRTYPGANQGSLVFAFQIALFMPPEQFKREMDEYVRRVRVLQPLEGFDQAYLAGGVEAERERQWRQEGIPLGSEHRQLLQDLAGEFGLQSLW